MKWGELYAFIAHCTGWTIDHIVEHMDIPRLQALQAVWNRFPPMPVMVAHYLGAAKPEPTIEQNEAALAELMSMGPEIKRASRG